MAHQQTRVDSIESARLLLDAWNGGDRNTLHRQLENTVAIQPLSDLSGMEYERWDLLAGIAENMRNAINRNPEGPVGCDIEVSVQLLQHLIADAPVQH
jgi:hypothetical protein